MRRYVRGAVAVLSVSALTLGMIPGSSAQVERADKPTTYFEPTAGKWTFASSFGEAEGSFKLKPGRNGSKPKVKKLKFKILEKDNGVACPEAGEVLKVKGQLTLRKGPKWRGSDLASPWISATKDKPYDNKFPDKLLGMKPAKVTVKTAAGPRNAYLAVSFLKVRHPRPHEFDLSMIMFPPGATDYSAGWCIFEADGKPGS